MDDCSESRLDGREARLGLRRGRGRGVEVMSGGMEMEGAEDARAKEARRGAEGEH